MVDLIQQYEVPISRLLNDILVHDHIQWHPIGQILHQLVTIRTY